MPPETQIRFRPWETIEWRGRSGASRSRDDNEDLVERAMEHRPLRGALLFRCFSKLDVSTWIPFKRRRIPGKTLALLRVSRIGFAWDHGSRGSNPVPRPNCKTRAARCGVCFSRQPHPSRDAPRIAGRPAFDCSVAGRTTIQAWLKSIPGMSGGTFCEASLSTTMSLRLSSGQTRQPLYQEALAGCPFCGRVYIREVNRPVDSSGSHYGLRRVIHRALGTRRRA